MRSRTQVLAAASWIALTAAGAAAVPAQAQDSKQTDGGA